MPHEIEKDTMGMIGKAITSGYRCPFQTPVPKTEQRYCSLGINQCHFAGNYVELTVQGGLSEDVRNMETNEFPLCEYVPAINKQIAKEWLV